MSSERPPTSPFGRYAVTGAKLAVSIVLLAVLFSRIEMSRLWVSARNASIAWLGVALILYSINVAASVWRWWLLLDAQEVPVPPVRLLGSFLVALFFNNFLPSNIGGDVVRISDTAKPAGSKTLATTIVLVDRLMGLMGLVLVAAVGATIAAGAHGRAPSPIWPSWLWVTFLVGAMAAAPALVSPAGLGRLLQPLTVFHPEWVGDRIDSVTATLERFRERLGALASCFGGAVFVQAITVAFYVAVSYALKIRVTPWDLAVIVPLSFVVQMLPVSVNGFGVREATFSFYFTRLGLPIESALLLSLGATALIMLFSLSGAAVYVTRRPARA
jgi:uncharacterized membrane protein YbhN (UPF0104 family)